MKQIDSTNVNNFMWINQHIVLVASVESKVITALTMKEKQLMLDHKWDTPILVIVGGKYEQEIYRLDETAIPDIKRSLDLTF